MIEAVLEALDLKEEKRTGWQLRNIADPESVADHTWGVSLLALLFGHSEDINLDKALKMSVIHDLPESRTGDIASRAEEENQEVSDQEKEIRELEAVSKISKDLKRNEIKQLWKEYNMENTPESKFVKDMDKIEMCLQALKYRKGRYKPEEDTEREGDHEGLDEFFSYAESEISTDTGKELFKEINQRYKEVKSSHEKL